MGTNDGKTTPPGDVAGAAQGWLRIQLAVLGFIGLCGVLQAGHAVPGPTWVAFAAAILPVSGLVLACVGIVLVGRVGWPWGAAAADDDERRARRLRLGVVLTFVAVAATVLAALANWWPDGDADAATTTASVRVTDVAGRSWCGQLTEGRAGALRVLTVDGAVDVDGGTVVTIVSVDRC